MTITELIKTGPQPYTHHYAQTMVGEETCTHILDIPKQLITLANQQAELITYNDGTLGIAINGKVWAVEDAQPELRPGKELPHKVWQYCRLAMGLDGDTYASTN